MAERADTIPGFLMQSENFFLKFITGLQCGVSSKLLEYETDWYEVMEIILSRLQDEPDNKERFEIIASRDLEYWARVQPGGEALNLKIRVLLEEKRYFQPPSGSRKTLRLIFNDRFSTQVLFHVRKKQLLRSLKDLAAVAVADQICAESQINELSCELPQVLLPTVRKAFNNCWTARHFRTWQVECPPWCSCKSDVYQVITNLSSPPPVTQPPVQPQQHPQPPEPSTSRGGRGSRKLPRKSTKKTKSRKLSTAPEEKSQRGAQTGGSCEKCSRKANKSGGKVSTRIKCRDLSENSDGKETSEEPNESEKVLRKYKSQLKQLKSRLRSYLSVNVKRLEKNIKTVDNDQESSPKRKSPRLIKLKERILHFRERKTKEEDIFEPRPKTRSMKRSQNAGGNKFTESKAVKRILRSNVMESSRKKRRHS